MAGALPSDDFKTNLIAEIKYLRAFAISLSGSVSAGDDLVQETLLRAWSKHKQFQGGTNLKAWLLTILRNIFEPLAEWPERGDFSCAERVARLGQAEAALGSTTRMI